MSLITFPPDARPMIGHPETSAQHMRSLFCVYEHSAIIRPGDPFETVFVGVCRLHELFTMREAFANTEWVRLTDNGAATVTIKIVAISNDVVEAQNFAFMHLRSFPEWPRCNKLGYNMHKTARTVVCSDGREFESQVAAAHAIGITPSAMSQHMRGQLKTVRGFRFAYKKDISQ